MGEHIYKYAYIIPIHVKNELIFRAIRSLSKMHNTKVIVSAPSDVAEWIEDVLKKDTTGLMDNPLDIITREDDGSSYQALVNYAITDIGYSAEFISILEFDDKVTPQAHDACDQYFIDNPDVEVFLPLAAMVTSNVPDPKDEEMQIVAMLNEAGLATGLADEYAKLDTTMLMKANFAFINGAYFRPSAFEQFGLFKENFEILYDYEFILRLVYNGVGTLVIPKICRFHFLREDGEFERQKNLPEDYRGKWLTNVRREYMFIDDRELTDD